MPRFRITYTKKRTRLFHTEESQSEIIEAPSLSDAERIGQSRLENYHTIDWTVSVEEIESGDTTKQETIIVQKEVVKVSCKYCGVLNEVTQRTCSNCGAAVRVKEWVENRRLG